MPFAACLSRGCLVIALAAALGGCNRGGVEPVAQRVDIPQAATAPGPTAEPASGVHHLGRDGALVEGRVIFEGMITATKGGYLVRGVVVDDAELRKGVAGMVDVLPADPEWFLGALVRVACELRRHQVDSAVGPDGIVVQTRMGTWFSATKIERIELVARAEAIEGTLSSSKGFFALGQHLVKRQDIAWAARGAGAGDRVRLWGQPRIVKCRPQEQCLIGGELPLFEVARGERLP